MKKNNSIKKHALTVCAPISTLILIALLLITMDIPLTGFGAKVDQFITGMPTASETTPPDKIANHFPYSDPQMTVRTSNKNG